MEAFLVHLNGIGKTVKFTMEVERDDMTFPFLDICRVSYRGGYPPPRFLDFNYMHSKNTIRIIHHVHVIRVRVDFELEPTLKIGRAFKCIPTGNQRCFSPSQLKILYETLICYIIHEMALYEHLCTANPVPRLYQGMVLVLLTRAEQLSSTP